MIAVIIAILYYLAWMVVGGFICSVLYGAVCGYDTPQDMSIVIGAFAIVIGVIMLLSYFADYFKLYHLQLHGGILSI